MQLTKCYIYWLFYPMVKYLVNLGIDINDPHDYVEQSDGTLKCNCCGWLSWNKGEGWVKE